MERFQDRYTLFESDSLLVFNGQILDRRFNAVQIAYLGNGLLGFAALPALLFWTWPHGLPRRIFCEHDPAAKSLQLIRFACLVVAGIAVRLQGTAKAIQ